MTYRGYLRLGGVEIANSARTRAYMANGVMPATSSLGFDDTWTFTSQWLGHQAYRLPKLDTAPWWNPNDLDSMDFAGLWPLQVEGLDNAESSREVIAGVGHGGSFGPPRLKHRTIRITALLVGRNTVGADYGLRWLTSILRGDRCKGDWTGQTLEYLSTVPDIPREVRRLVQSEVGGLLPGFVPGDSESIPNPSELIDQWIREPNTMPTETLQACVNPYRRQMFEVVCTKSPEITERFGVDRESSAPHASAYRVEFELTAGIPWAYRPTQPWFQNLAFDMAATPTPIYFTIAGQDGCVANQCQTVDTLFDPLSPSRPSLLRPIAPSTSAMCEPLETRRLTASIPAAAIADFDDTLGTVTVRASTVKDERQLRIRWVKNVPGLTLEDRLRCHTVSEAEVRYIPQGGSLTLDAVTARPYVTLTDGTRLDASPVVSGADGGPWRPPVLACGTVDHTLVIDAPGTVGAGVRIDAAGTVREP